MGKVNLEELATHLATAIQGVWESEWRRADLAYILVANLPHRALRAVAGTIARSHQDLYRWAAQASLNPPDSRRLDRAPRTHWTTSRIDQEAHRLRGEAENR